MSRRKKNDDELVCSFCGCTEDESPLLPGVDAYICIDCVKKANQLITLHEQSGEKKKNAPPPLLPVPTPKEIKKFLDSHVIGHDDVKKVLAVAVHNHYRRIEATENAAQNKPKKQAPAGYAGFDDVEIEKGSKWTVVSADRSWSCHEEHTVAVFDDHTEVLTDLDYNGNSCLK